MSIQERLDRIMKRMNTEIIYPKDRLSELEWNDILCCWVFPKGTPKNEGRYLSLLLLRLEEEFPDSIFEQAKMVKTCKDKNTKHLKRYVHTIKVSGPETFTIKAEAEIYEPPYRKIIVVGVSLTKQRKTAVQKQ